MNTSTISKAARDRREGARQGNGEFGTQTHDDSGIVEVSEPVPDIARHVFLHPSSGILCEDANRVYKWAELAGEDFTWVKGNHIDIAMHGLLDDGTALMEGFDGADDDARWAAADQHMAAIVAETKRRVAAENELELRRLARPVPLTVAKANRALKQTMQDAIDLGLIPAGATVTASVSGSAQNPYTMVRLEGVPDDKIMVRSVDSEGSRRDYKTVYGFALDRFLSNTVTDTVRPLYGRTPWPTVVIETSGAKAYRVASEAEEAAGKAFRKLQKAGGDTREAYAAHVAAIQARSEAARLA